MDLIPAIDLYHGKCVRLFQGRFDQITAYEIDVTTLAKSYASEGAQWLHVVDLNGAENGVITQLDLMTSLKKESGLRLQIGGGIRTLSSIQSVLENNIDRVVLGSMAVKDVIATQQALNQFGVDRITLALDVFIENETPFVAINGWKEKTQQSLASTLNNYSNYPGLHVLCTDISRDGVLCGPNIEFYRQCTQQFSWIKWQASGGVSQLADLTALDSSGVSAVIIGKSLLEGRFTLRDAITEMD